MDPISDMLIQIKNAALVGKPAVALPFSNLKHEIAKVLQKEGYLKSVVKKGKKVKKLLACDLAYGENGKAKVTDVSRVSKSSRRVYVGVKEIRSVRQGSGSMVLSTPKGIMTDKEAKLAGVGGEVLFKIW
ncbi:MAG: 30S ribosomal protein S8 [Candidatus Vogelbacteria bacterium]|nr:30S ribosomal protein S8 [Candidatus Vogelbacteria bacterium]